MVSSPTGRGRPTLHPATAWGAPRSIAPEIQGKSCVHKGLLECDEAGTLVALQTYMQPLQCSVKIAPELSREFLLHHRICPLRKSDEGALITAVGARVRSDALADLERLYDCPVVTELVDDADLDRLIERSTSSRGLELTIAGPADSVDGFDDTFADARDLASQPPIIRYVNLLIQDACEAGASDVHLEATSNGMVTRFRLDGVLTTAPQPPARQELAVISRLKLLAALDIAERRRPQDGRIRWRLGEREVDVRVSTVPTMFGESVVLRVLDKGGRPVELEELGLDQATLVAVDLVARRPNGLFLVTGPTGSGKTTTLYACLSRRDTVSEKAITVEDPVEYQLAGVTQVPVNRAADVTFASALRSILREPGARCPVSARTSSHPPARPGRDHDRANARRRDGGDRDAGRDDGAPRLLHAAHEQCARRVAAPSRSRRA